MKKLISALSAIILTAFLCSCSGSTNSSAPISQETSFPAFDLSDYKADASAYMDLTYQASVILANIGNYENNYWKALGYLSEDMPNRAFEWLEGNSEETRETVSASNEDISSAYESLILTDFGENTDAAEIDAEIRALYASYSTLYALVTEPSGTREDFVLSLSGLIEDVETTNNTLSGLLSEDG